jgi:SAM-dependent methyltransferase
VPAVTYPAPIEQVMTPIDQSQLRPRRQRLLQRAHGRVLELGGAGGVNLEHYPADRVSEIVVVGADGASRARLRRTAARRGLSVDLRTLAQVGTGYDTVVAAFTLSALTDLDRELDALRQLLAPDGRLLFLDHSPRRPAGVATDLSRPLWRLMVDGFVPGRDLPGAIRQSGLIILSIERFGLTTLTLPLRSCVAGVARQQRPGGARRVEGDR